MRKQLAGLLTVTAALTILSVSQAFAGTWQQDTNGWKYLNDNGSYQGMGWFTDPSTGSEYFFDPDGYMMHGTHVEGYWLDDSGVKHEKSQAEIESENRRKERLASRPAPGKEASAAAEAAKTAVTSGIASGTKRIVYSEEMLKLYDSIFLEAKKGLVKSEYKDYKGSISKDNLQTIYYYDVQDRGRVLEGTIWKSSKEGSASYTPYAIEMKYNRNLVPEREDSQYFETAFKSLLTAALGQTEGQNVYNRIIIDAASSDASYTLNGTTDTGNTYELTYRNNTADIKVICSEADSAEEIAAAEAAAAAAAAQSEFEEAEAQPQQTTSVITAGQSKKTEQQEETEATAEETQDTSSEAAAE